MAKTTKHNPSVRPASGWTVDRVTTHPGVVLQQDFLAELGLSQHGFAQKIRVPATRIGEIVRSKRAVTPETALRFARFFGTSPEFWLNLQQAHDLSSARITSGKRIEKEVEIFSLAS